MSTKHVKTKSAVKTQPTSRSGTTNNTKTIIMGVLVLVIASFIAYTLRTEQDTTDDNSLNRSFASHPAVPVITIHDAHDTTFVQRYINKHLRTAETRALYQHATDWPWPAVFRGTAVTHWTALRTWSATRLGSVLGDVVLKDVYRNNNTIFGPYYDASRPLSHVPGITRVNPHQLIDLSARELFMKLAAPVHNNTYYYYSGNIQHVEALVDDILPFDVMLQLDPSGTDQNVNVWFGMNGVTAANHYDGYDNLYAQIHGTKRWVLVPPSQSRAMSLYPFLHPHHAQSRVDSLALALAAPELRARDWPRALNVTPLIVDLAPGDLLYLPSMWFHRVEARDGVSLSVNSWTRTPESALMNKIAEQLPFTNEQSRDQKLAAAVAYLRALLRASKLDDRQDFADIYQERYEPLIRAGELSLTAVRCSDALSTSSTESLGQSHALEFATMGQHTRRLWRHNHIEYVLYYALEQELLRVASVLHCLAQ